MDTTSYLALSRIDTLTRALDVTANNLANTNTDGFKGSRVLFSDYLSKQHNAHGLGSEKTLNYNQDKATYRDNLQGELRTTGNPLDLAINGRGYFAVRTQQGVRLTRDGKFQYSNDGTIVDSAGNPLLDNQNRNITLDPQDIPLRLSVASDGTISTDRGRVGSINLVTVDNTNTLKAEGDHLFRPTTPLRAVDTKEIRQGMLEASNVNPVAATTEMVKIQREYDLNFQLLQKDFTRRLNALDKITSEPTA
ncbi:flagellar basal-body rod protein FlgF (plasmid) [Aristophania vespae]|uniref:Flagellar basal-body rod protein FlgF n=1 Tax=Aristophania vespae TaxID=2697033 RepID=A0A6P1NCS6_9PROT|nr:flagellar basal-body rod protein FlgF [Aristophania vespae]QHI96465.1 flagellar basal-body rod protein FlgF [Aristophania vespae]UMM64797.1 Flagellar basal-body rod protein FlgG [Aristophania vespae]